MMGRFQRAVVGVVLGGSSAEREVSLATGRACAAALKRAGYRVVEIDWTVGAGSGALLAARIDVAFLALHGGYGEDGSIQGFLNCLGIPYTGSGVLASALAMDKPRSKALFVNADVRTPDYVVLGAKEVEARLRRGDPESPVGFPCVVKPTGEGSSVGVSIVTEPSGFVEALETALRGDGGVLVEVYVEGHELSVGIFDDLVLGTVQIVPASQFYNYEAKYQSDATQYLIPPPIDEGVRRSVEDLAARAYGVLGCRGVARVDVMLDIESTPWVLEVNTLPGMTDHSLVPKLAQARGIDFEELVVRMVESARTDEAAG